MTAHDGSIWPAGYVAAASLTFDVDAESAILNIDPKSADRMTVMSHQAYGPTIGVPDSSSSSSADRSGPRSSFPAIPLNAIPMW